MLRRKRDRQTDRQTDREDLFFVLCYGERETDRQTDRRTERICFLFFATEKERQTERRTERQTDREDLFLFFATENETDKEIDRDRQTEREEGADPITPGAWHGSYWSANFKVTGTSRQGKIPTAQAGIEPRIFCSRGGRLYH